MFSRNSNLTLFLYLNFTLSIGLYLSLSLTLYLTLTQTLSLVLSHALSFILSLVLRGVTIWLWRLQRNTNTKTNFKCICNITPKVITEYNLCCSISPLVIKLRKTCNLCILQHVALSLNVKIYHRIDMKHYISTL